MTSKSYQCGIYSRDERSQKYLYQIPPKKGRYIVLDTETTGLEKDDHIIELGACEILNGHLTGDQFHIYIQPRRKMEQRVVDLHGITNHYYDEYYKDVYQNDKQNLLNFSKWVGNSIIFAHNAPFDMNAVNKELFYWSLHEFPVQRYRCSMRIFREIVSQNEPLYDEKYTSLEKCCEYFGLNTNDKVFHNALFDSYMTARLICKLYEKIDSDPILYKDFDYNNESKDSHYYAYINNKFDKNNKFQKNNINQNLTYLNHNDSSNKDKKQELDSNINKENEKNNKKIKEKEEEEQNKKNKEEEEEIINELLKSY